MADINQVITLGVGTPAGITEFLTLGLQIAEAAVVEGAYPTEMNPRSLVADLPRRRLANKMAKRNLNIVMVEKD